LFGGGFTSAVHTYLKTIHEKNLRITTENWHWITAILFKNISKLNSSIEIRRQKI
jgi:hypothetical protein